jgi:hypothetical protein
LWGAVGSQARTGPVFEEAAFNISRPSAAAEISLAAFEHRFGA